MVVSNGAATATSESDIGVRVPNRAPVAWIDSPAVPMTYPLGGRVTISGAAQDAEDRGVPDAAMTWSSSIDGPLGTGPEVMTRGLSAGTHTITLEAVDTDGAVGSASIELTVDGSVVEASPPRALETAIAGILDHYASGLDPSAAFEATPAADAGIPIPVLLSVGLVLLAVGGTSVWIRVAQPHPSGAAAGGAGPARFREASGLKVEQDVIEAPPDEPSPPRATG
jgi:hypothetical protein